MEQNRKPPHPLWEFFHVTETAKEPLTGDAQHPPDMGSLQFKFPNKYDRE